MLCAISVNIGPVVLENKSKIGKVTERQTEIWTDGQTDRQKMDDRRQEKLTWAKKVIPTKLFSLSSPQSFNSESIHPTCPFLWRLGSLSGQSQFPRSVHTQGRVKHWRFAWLLGRCGGSNPETIHVMNNCCIWSYFCLSIFAPFYTSKLFLLLWIHPDTFMIPYEIRPLALGAKVGQKFPWKHHITTL